MKRPITSQSHQDSASANQINASVWLAGLIFILSVLLLGWAIFPPLPHQVMQYVRTADAQRRAQEMLRLLAKDSRPVR